MSEQNRGMTKIFEGVRVFQDEVFETKAALFKTLDKGQNPPVLFITCSDSRINPNLLTQTEPGDLFILRNAGNIVPRHGFGGGEEATVEYAVMSLKVRHIVICGHSNCGAVIGLLNPPSLASLPSVARWLENSRDVVARVDQAGDLSPRERLRLAIEQNVLTQMEHLRTHPCVNEAMAAGDLSLHAWVYDFGAGEVWTYDAATQRYTALSAAHTEPHADEAVRQFI
jgi:carbonic anhydrase